MVKSEYIEEKSDVSVSGDEHKSYYCMFFFKHESLKKGVTYTMVMYDPSTRKIHLLDLGEKSIDNYEFYSYDKKLSSKSKRGMIRLIFINPRTNPVEELLDLAGEAGII